MEKYKIRIKGIVTNGSGYFMLKKWYDDRIEDPYQWEFPEGLMEFGESPEHAAERIIAEETGLVAQAAKPLYTWQYLLGEVSYIGICYLLYSETDEAVISEEYTEGTWVNRLEFSEYIKNPKLLSDIEKADL